MQKQQVHIPTTFGHPADKLSIRISCRQQMHRLHRHGLFRVQYHKSREDQLQRKKEDYPTENKTISY